jgi:transcriptional regulator with XRE-family HTH domain
MPDDALRGIQLAEARQLSESGRGRQIRLGARLSIHDIAKAIETNDVNVLRWETGQRRPTSEPGARWGQYLLSLERLGLAEHDDDEEHDDEPEDDDPEDDDPEDDEEPGPSTRLPPNDHHRERDSRAALS